MTAPSPIAEAREVRCPRCGYDQRGVVENWKDSCPLQGVCSECGLGLDWAEVLRPTEFEPKWCIEFVPRSRGVILAIPRTLVRSLGPLRFWRRMRLSFEVRRGRLVLYAVVLSMIPALLYVAMQASIALYVRKRVSDNLRQINAMTPTRLARTTNLVYQPTNRLLVLPSQRIADRARFEIHKRRSIARTEAMIARPASLEQSALTDVFDAVFRPNAEDSSGGIRYPDFTIVYPAPASLHARVTHRERWNDTYIPPTALGPGALAATAWFGWLGALLLPLTLLLLPATLRACRVRRRHLGRIAAYSMWIPSTMLSLSVLLVAAGMLSFRIAHRLVPLVEWLPYVTFLLLMLWWWAGIKCYLRLPHAAAVTVLSGTLCALVVAAVAYWSGVAASL